MLPQAKHPGKATGGFHTGTQPFVKPLDRPPHGDNGRQGGVKAVVQYLKQLFLRPGRSSLNAQVIQRQHRHIANLLEQVIIGNGIVRGIGSPQMVEQVGGHDKVGGKAQFNAAIGGRHGQLRLAAAAGAGKSQPALGIGGKGGGRFPGRPEHSLADRIRQRPLRADIVQRNAAEFAQVAVAMQGGDPPGRFQFLAAAGKRLAKIGMTHRHPLADPPSAVADGTRRPLRLLRANAGDARPIAVGNPPDIAVGDPAQDVAQAFHFQSSPPATGPPRL